jgi:hypothetical protein
MIIDSVNSSLASLSKYYNIIIVHSTKYGIHVIEKSKKYSENQGFESQNPS